MFTLRSAVLGSTLLLTYTACRADRPDTLDTTTPSQETTGSQSASPRTAPHDPSSPDERAHVTGKEDDPSSIKQEPKGQDRPVTEAEKQTSPTTNPLDPTSAEERKHVTGRDDELPLGNGGTGGGGSR